MVWLSNYLVVAFCCLWVVSLGVEIEIINDDMTAFNHLIEELNLTFTSARELIKRLNAFNKAKQEVQELGNKYPGVTFEVNKFSLMTDQELKQFMNVSISAPDNTVSSRAKRNSLDNTWSSSIPTSYDFRTLGKVTSVKDQGSCGSCWAFSSTGAIESQYSIRFNQTIDLAEQSFVNCDTNQNGCGGGAPEYALRYYATESGLPYESCFPYEGEPVSQACTDCESPRVKIAGYRNYGPDEDQWASYIYNYGPASMSFYVPRAFMSYKSGILDVDNSECTWDNSVGGHAILLVGYTPDYWIAKNSWGTGWGENGFIRFKRGKNFCLMRDIVAPYFEVLEPPKPLTTCAGALDLVFVIDGSDTMTAARFNVVRSQLITAITQAGIQWGGDKAHVGIVLSTGLMTGGATTPYRYLDLNGCQYYAWDCSPTVKTTTNLISAIQNMGFYGGKNNISLSMMETITGEYEGLPDSWSIFGGPYWNDVGDRIDIPNVMIVISGADTSNVAPATAALAAKGVTVFSIGFSDLPTAQLQAISGDPSRSYSTTPENLANVIKNICLFQNLPSTTTSTSTTTKATTTTPTTTSAPTTSKPTTIYQPPTTTQAPTTTTKPTTTQPTTTPPTTTTTSPTTTTTTPTTTVKPPTTTTQCPQGGTWSEWSTPSCNDTCGLCGLMVETRECISAASGCPCIGEATRYGERCGDAICKFPKPSCCSAYAKPTNVGGIIKCAPLPTTPAPTTTTTPATTTKATTTMPPTTTKPATTTAPFPPITTCAGAIDLVFVIDGSDTMTAARFNTVKSQLATSVTQSGIVWGSNNAHVGIVISTGLMQGGATTPYRHLDLNGCQFYADGCTPTVTTTANLITAIQGMTFDGGKNNIFLSMNETMSGEYDGLPDSWYIFGDPYWGTIGDRPDVPDVMIVISGADTSNVAPATTALLNKGIRVYSIGFSDLPTAQLQAISGSPARSYSTTPENLANVIKTICLFQ